MDRAVPPVWDLQAENDESNGEDRDVKRCNHYVHVASSESYDSQVQAVRLAEETL
jgi:hypothetical protein